MRVLLFNEVGVARGGGSNQYVLDMAARLRESGDAVGLVHGRSSAKPGFSGTGYVFGRLGRAARLSPVDKERLIAILIDFEPDLVQIHGVENPDVDRFLLERVPCIRFVHHHGMYCSGGAMTWAIPRRVCERRHSAPCLWQHVVRGCGSTNPVLNMLNHRKVTRWLALLRSHRYLQVASPVVRENLIANGVPPENIELIPLYAPEPAAPKRDLRTARRIILHPGGLTQNKGVWLMVRAVRHLPRDVELVFAGSGNQSQRLAAHIKSAGLSERVRIMGDLAPEAWSELYYQAELVVFPSRWNEPVGIQGLYSMAHGKPVIAFRSGGVEAWLEHEKNGFLVDFNDSKGFVRAINTLLAAPKTLSEMGRNGRRIWEERFRSKYHVARVREFFARVAAGKAAA